MKVEKGNTQAGVNQWIADYLRANFTELVTLFDIPCGEGDFLRSWKKISPATEILGQDLYAQPLPELGKHFIRAPAQDWSHVQGKSFQVVTCISGVMVFDDIPGLCQRAYKHLPPGGLFILTNDNVLTVRDRISFLLFGRVKRFKKYYSPSEGNWNLVLIQGLWKHLISTGFRLKTVSYVSMRAEDWLFLPLALLLYALESIHRWVAPSKDMDPATRARLFPLKSLLARHYILVAEKASAT